MRLLFLLVSSLCYSLDDYSERQFTVVSSVGKESIMVSNSTEKKVVFKRIIRMSKFMSRTDHISWIRVIFDKEKTFLRKGNGTGWGINLPGDVIRITSLLDYSVQYLNNETLEQWNHQSAFFNGQKVRVELLSSTGGDIKPSLFIQYVQIRKNSLYQLPGLKSLCNENDTRKPTSDARTGRIFPVGCSAWTFNDKKGCQLTAGHCLSQITDYIGNVFQTNVPQTLFVDINGKYRKLKRHPHPMHQWAIDEKSMQYSDNKNPNDYGYFGVFRNPNTGLTPREVAGSAFELADSETPVQVGDVIRVSGYGDVMQKSRYHLHRTLQTSTGTITALNGNKSFSYRADTMPGSSGSVVYINGTNIAIGIHTDGGCGKDEETSNMGVLVSHPDFIRMIRNPLGVCQ